MRIWAVARNTFREAVRDKALYVLLFFAGVAIFGSKALGWVSVGQDIKIMKDISLAAVTLFGVLISIFVGTNLVYKEIDKRTLYTVLSRPMRRYEFILGKYMGLAMLLAVVTVAMTGLTALYIILFGGVVDVTFFAAALLAYCELLLVTAIAVMLSSLASPILGALIVFSVFVFGHATDVLVDLPPQFDGTLSKRILEGVYFVLPNLNNFNIRAEAANAVHVSLAYIGWAVLYGMGYTALVLLAAILAFEERDV